MRTFSKEVEPLISGGAPPTRTAHSEQRFFLNNKYKKRGPLTNYQTFHRFVVRGGEKKGTAEITKPQLIASYLIFHILRRRRSFSALLPTSNAAAAAAGSVVIISFFLDFFLSLCLISRIGDNKKTINTFTPSSNTTQLIKD